MRNSQTQKNHNKRVAVAEKVALRLKNNEVVVLSARERRPFNSTSAQFRKEMKERFKQRVEQAFGGTIEMQWRYHFNGTKRSDGTLFEAIVQRSS